MDFDDDDDAFGGLSEEGCLFPFWRLKYQYLIIIRAKIRHVNKKDKPCLGLSWRGSFLIWVPGLLPPRKREKKGRQKLMNGHTVHKNGGIHI